MAVQTGVGDDGLLRFYWREEIAKELVISKETVRSHLYHAVRKLGLKKIDELRGMKL